MNYVQNSRLGCKYMYTFTSSFQVLMSETLPYLSEVEPCSDVMARPSILVQKNRRRRGAWAAKRTFFKDSRKYFVLSSKFSDDQALSEGGHSGHMAGARAFEAPNRLGFSTRYSENSVTPIIEQHERF